MRGAVVSLMTAVKSVLESYVTSTTWGVTASPPYPCIITV
jgi:hypothetical protein